MKIVRSDCSKGSSAAIRHIAGIFGPIFVGIQTSSSPLSSLSVGMTPNKNSFNINSSALTHTRGSSEWATYICELLIHAHISAGEQETDVVEGGESLLWKITPSLHEQISDRLKITKTPSRKLSMSVTPRKLTQSRANNRLKGIVSKKNLFGSKPSSPNLQHQPLPSVHSTSIKNREMTDGKFRHNQTDSEYSYQSHNNNYDYSYQTNASSSPQSPSYVLSSGRKFKSSTSSTNTTTRDAFCKRLRID